MTRPLSLTLPAELRSISRARHAVADYGDAVGADRAKVALATTEAVTNAINHGARCEGSERIHVDAERTDDDLVVRVTDEGGGMRPHPESRGLRIGMSLIGAMTSEVKLATSGGGVRVTMRFPCLAN